MRQRWCVIACLVGSASTARAVELTGPTVRHEEPVPELVVIAHGAHGTERSYRLLDTGDPDVSIAPRTVHAVRERLAVGFVIQGDASWLSPVRDQLAAMLDGLALADAATCLVTYSAGDVRIDLPRSPSRALRGSVLPPAAGDRRPGDLAAAIGAALIELDGAAPDRRLLFIIGDRTALADGVDLGVAMRQLAGARDVRLVPVVEPMAEVGAHIRRELARERDVTAIVFPGDELRWDARIHELRVARPGDTGADAAELFERLELWWPHEAASRWPTIAGGAAAAVVALGAALLVRRRAQPVV